ncbi:uncharacterized protein LOC109853564 [Pseudomyrmex gracilis]|uniref:uncharacterized protein LOC109853564 n=1 Tax=Pseudomyrmex gracilis TaxID=219809 RepID=UPI000995BD8D|nr:uncharacterized protein LOC109853564 [Pseudomyrmex gracilis]XP_020281395.1 uncharacterized protein LOC109853564 [Pseudomyrmex gracilis]
MPGIYVRTFSKFNWIDSKKESFLTIPGSYWLCCKKNIYKFIFRYHRTMRNTEQFPYGRELLKIIRRIIKCHPSQGQQFGTQHLLVTYNCTSWTRQDKMFAILKFQQRQNAATFSHAFVLTIQISSSEENSSRNLRCPIVGDVESNVPLAIDEAAKSVICNKTSAKETETCQSKTIDQISQHNEVETTSDEVLETSNSRDNVKDSVNVNKHQDGSTTAMYLVNESGSKLLSNVIGNKSVNFDVRNQKKAVKHSIEDAQERCSKRKKTDVSKEQRAINQNSKSLQKERSWFTEIANVTRDSSSPGPKLNENARAVDAEDDKDNNNKNVPYRYFFEKDIESEKHNRKSNTLLATDRSVQEDLSIERKNNETSIGNDKILDSKSEESNGNHTLANGNNQSQSNAHHKSCRSRKQKARESEKKAIPDKILRTSNITDLVMEGLMFTIRQDQDSVAVIEQKTKLEVDEVLENSEKAETKAGEKCLLNSSLLRLENMVTMFDSPHEKRARRKTGHAGISNNAYSIPTLINSSSVYPSTTVYSSDANFLDRRMNRSNVPIVYSKHNTANDSCRWERDFENMSDMYSVSGSTTGRSDLMEWQSSDNEQDVTNKTSNEKEEKRGDDVTPESFQSTVFSTEETILESQNRNPLIDTNTEVTYKCDISAEDCGSLSDSTIKTSAEETSPISEEPADKSRDRTTSVPRIISNKIITIDQMPFVLQNVVRSARKTTRGFSSAASSGETSQRRDSTTSSSEDAISKDSSLKNKREDLCAASAELDETELDESSVTIDVGNGNASPRNRKERNNGTHRGSRRPSSRHHHSSPRKLQDITEEFYYDLLAQNKDDVARQRRLRQRRKCASNDVKNGKVRIEMLKFIQDITEGARVVVRRLNIE